MQLAVESGGTSETTEPRLIHLHKIRYLEEGNGELKAGYFVGVDKE